VSVPAETPKEDTISLQLSQGTWQQPIPLWPLGNDQWMILLFVDPAVIQNLQYRICRNDQCDIAYDESSFASPISLANLSSNTSSHMVTSWHAWHAPGDLTTDTIFSEDPQQLIGVEFTPDFKPNDLSRYRDSLDELQNSVSTG